jgi:hypothetical protein
MFMRSRRDAILRVLTGDNDVNGIGTSSKEVPRKISVIAADKMVRSKRRGRDRSQAVK